MPAADQNDNDKTHAEVGRLNKNRSAVSRATR